MISILIPAHNESQTLQKIVGDVQNSTLWKSTREREIILCINGSTDGTDLLAEDLAFKNPDIRVIKLTKKSKGLAWTSLVRASSERAEIILFLDADVRIDPETLSLLHKTLYSDRLNVIVSATLIPFSTNNTLYQQLLCRHLSEDLVREKWGICSRFWGGCYAMLRSAALEIAMPEDSRIAEDAFLQRTFTNRILILEKAICWFRLPSLVDHVLQRARDRVSERTLAQYFPKCGNRAGLTDRLTASVNYFLKLSFRGKLMMVVCYPVEILSLICARWWQFSGRDSWHALPSTKH